MTYILGGSRHIVNLPSEVEELLGEKLSINEIFYIGDAPGSDTAFQYFFAKKNYLANDWVVDDTTKLCAPPRAW